MSTPGPAGPVDPTTRFARSRDALETDAVRGPAPGLVPALVRRGAGRYPRDAFGADPWLQDLLAPGLARGIRVRVDGGAEVPASGPAVVVANRRFGLVEPLALQIAVRAVAARRLRVAGRAPLPGAGELGHRLGLVGTLPEDLRAALRAGHLAAVLLSPTGLRTAAGEVPVPAVGALAHFPVVPAAVRPGGPAGLPVRPWVVRFGPLLAPPPDGGAAGAAELAARAREAVAALL